MMASNDRPFVLHVDDAPDDLSAWVDEVRGQGRVAIEAWHPDDVTEEHLRRASLVLVDFRIEDWARRDNAGALALKPTNGLALLSVLQEAAYDLDKDTPRAFALFTAVVRDVARGLVPQPYIVARAHNLEWVFDKTGGSLSERATRVAELAEAIRRLPTPWPGETAEQPAAALRAWLCMPDAPWSEIAWEGVVRCHPPMHEFAEHTHGIGVLRWALHRIWPYPTFLLDDAHLAARLRIDLASLRSEFATNARLQAALAPAVYEGPLSEFLGRRWWRAAIESIVFDLASADPANISILHDHLKSLAPGLGLLGTGVVFPVLDATFSTQERLASADDVVEVVPDDWPPFADPAWALKTETDAHMELAAVALSGGAGEE